MSRRTRHRLRPALERCEARELPSGIIALMASNAQEVHSAVAGGGGGHGTGGGSATTGGGGSGPNGFPFSTTSIAVSSNQGPTGTNLVLTPTGQLTPHELKRETFLAAFSGTYTVGPGQFSDESKLINIRAAGGSNQMRHDDIQMRLAVPTDPTQTVGGTASIFDRNLNSNSVLGLDLSAPQTNVDSGGRPNQLTASLDVNTSAGTYAEGYFQGAINIHYFPSGRHSGRILDQGKVDVKIIGQVYTTGTNFILGNSNINP